ncbi:MAG: lytic transglycosylase domain-containing protein [Microbacteriaceae bacterium]|jgi:hypothetical protein|nr:lytic transglycosylase domain-containing protein [Microbacteriaceae bacterium]MCI1207149.1 lytic transglycosylase domain-containing protein [Microbacteriaceae bacterium]
MAFSKIATSIGLIAGLGFSVVGGASAAYASEPLPTSSAAQSEVQTFQYAYQGAQSSPSAHSAFTASAPSPTPQVVAAPSTGAQSSQTSQTTQTVVVASGDAQQIAAGMVGNAEQFSCLVKLWNRESGWRTTAQNPSGAYGIPQALPGSKMASAGADWRTNAATQIKWGLGYISGRYGTPCGAWGHSQSTGWY